MPLGTPWPASCGPAPGPMMVICPTGLACYASACDAVGPGQRVAGWESLGLDPGGEGPGPAWPGGRERRDVPDPAASQHCLADFLAGDAGDAAAGDLPGGEPAAEDQRREDHHRGGRVMALGVAGRVWFGQAGALHLRQGLLIGHALAMWDKMAFAMALSTRRTG